MYKFESREERDKILETFKQKEIEFAKIKDNNGKVFHVTFTLDENGVPDKNAKIGTLLVGFFSNPHLLTKARCMDLILSGKLSEAGHILFNTAFMNNESSSEIHTDDKYKLGIFPRLSELIDAVSPDVKKN